MLILDDTFLPLSLLSTLGSIRYPSSSHSYSALCPSPIIHYYLDFVLFLSHCRYHLSPRRPVLDSRACFRISFFDLNMEAITPRQTDLP